MYTKLFSLENRTLSQLKFTHGINYFIPKFFQKIIPLFLILYLPIAAFAQSCPPEANFSYSATDCDISFSQLYTGPGTVTHLWEFFNSNTSSTPYSSSTAANPIHSFNPSSGNTVLVRHTITITINGQTQTLVCEQNVVLNCLNPCFNYYFYYQVNGCTLSIINTITGIPNTVWDFGDGTAPVTSSGLPTHTYTTSGTYIVSVSINGKECSLPVTIDCGMNPCCTAAFTANVYRDCGVLNLSLDPQCVNGTHHWEINPIPSVQCGFQMNNFQPMGGQQTFQITNINTNIVTAIQIIHRFTCSTGQVLTITQTIATPPDGIYIGVRGTSSNLTDWNCVLPGSQYTLSSPIVYVAGEVKINKAFNFSNANIQFDAGLSGFTCNSQLNFTLDHCNLNSPPDCDCLWRGLLVVNKGRLTTTNTTNIEDALYGIWVNQPVAPLLNIDNTTFSKDFTGIRIDGNSGLFTFNTFERNSFNGTGPLKKICSLGDYMNSVFTTPAPNIGSALTTVNYVNGQGFAGLYLNRIRLNLLVKADGLKNNFNGLAYGIIAHNSQLKIDQNSFFRNIAGTYYPASQTAGIALFDQLGNSNISYNGVLPGGGTPDFENCTLGIYARSQQGIIPTNIGVTNSWIRNCRTGIYLDARYNNGFFRGTANTPGFAGIAQNTISATVQDIDLPAIAGVNLTDWGTTQSEVEIYSNTINCANSLGTQPFSSGISAFGAYPLNDIPGINEVDIHDNTVDVTDFGETGIEFITMPNGTIRNNHGVTLPANFQWISGIRTFGGRHANVLCNTVTRSAGFAFASSLFEFNSDIDGDYIGNISTGLATGIRVEGDCSGAQIRCNEMNSNQLGLLYTGTVGGAIPAITGPQGTASETNGNLWKGTPFTNGGAVHQGTIPPIYLSSVYSFRANQPNETPLNFIIPNLNWFVPANLDATANCLIQCPAPPQFMKPGVITSLDASVANNQLNFSGYPFSNEQIWRSSFSLYRKLLDYPDLAPSNNSIQTFFNNQNGGDISSLWQAQIAIRTLLTPPAAIRSALADVVSTLNNISQQIATTDAAISGASSESQIASLQDQRAIQDSLMRIQQAAFDVISNQWQTTVSSSVSGIVNQINNITPGNNSASSLTSLLTLYLQNFIQGQTITASQEILLKDIAGHCLAQHGPAVLAARTLYQKSNMHFEDCFTAEDRLNSETPSNSSVTIYPNPSDGTFTLKLSHVLAQEDVNLTVVNTLGAIVYTSSTGGKSSVILHLSQLPNGIYQLKLRTPQGASENKAILIQH